MLPDRASDIEDADDELYEEDDFPFQANRYVKQNNQEITSTKHEDCILCIFYLSIFNM
jgi:hypothetical protein